MTDPLRSESAADAAAEVPEREREARVEELLLSGLDHYFAARYDLAINVWTRVLFLDRGHARARAYIERARSAVAERQREGEELIHAGVAAFQRGEPDAARRLLTAALERGAASDEAFSLLDRLNRLAAAGGPAEPLRRELLAVTPRPVSTQPAPDDRRSRLTWIAAGAVLGVLSGAAGLGLLWGRADDLFETRRSGTSPPVVTSAAEPVPVPAPADVWILRAHRLIDAGRLREALAALEEIGPGDARRTQADDLRATIQRRLLESSRGTGAVRGGPAGDAAR